MRAGVRVAQLLILHLIACGAQVVAHRLGVDIQRRTALQQDARLLQLVEVVAAGRDQQHAVVVAVGVLADERVLDGRAEIRVHAVDDLERLDLLEDRPVVERGGGQRVDRAGDLDLPPVVDQDQLARVDRGIRVLLVQPGDVGQLGQRRIGRGHRPRRARQNARNARAVFGGRVGLGAVCHAVCLEIHDRIVVRHHLGQHALDVAVRLAALLEPGHHRLRLGRGQVGRAAQVIHLLRGEIRQRFREVGVFCIRDIQIHRLGRVDIAQKGAFDVRFVVLRQCGRDL